MKPGTGTYKPSQYASLRAEAFCAALLDNGVFFDDITVEHTGAFRRNYRNDINDVDDLHNGINLQLNRDGLYDKLPEGLFHQSLGSGRTSELQDMVAEHRRYRDEEKAARRFFQPVEQEIFRYAVMAESEERSLLFSTLNGEVSPAFFSFWDIAEDLPREAAEMMIRLMPLQRRIKGRPDVTAHALALLLDRPVQIRVSCPSGQTAETAAFRPGRDCLLGIDTITGNRFAESAVCWTALIEDVSSAELIQFTPEGSFGRFLTRFAEIFIPLDVEWKTELIRKEIVSEEEQTYIMGYGFYI